MLQKASTDARYIVQDIRLPRVIMALLCGAMLGMAGAAMQSIARNALPIWFNRRQRRM
ncbi:hypothetical protein DMI65_08040 [Escherichia coli]|nr:hypothetical protein [Escherichia coli]